MVGTTTPSIAELNVALKLLRGLLPKLGIVFVVGILASLLLVEIGLISTIVALLAVLWVDGRAMGRALHDPLLLSLPPLGVMSAPTIIAQHAQAAGMEWSGFFGPLRPARRK